MPKKPIPGGTAHELPTDMRRALASSPSALSAWGRITPLARNEWICWTVSVKRDETRREHLRRMVDELGEGKRRPCCWIGCIHRADKPISPSIKAVLDRRGGKERRRR